MNNPSTILALVALTAALLVGCVDDAPSIEFDDNCQDLPEDPYYGPGDASDEALAAKVPGFAGAYVLPNSMGIGIYLTDPAIGPLYEDVIRQHFADRPGGWSGNLTFAQVQYSYYQLMEWRAAFFSSGGWTALEVDILANAVVVFIDDENAVPDRSLSASARSWMTCSSVSCFHRAAEQPRSTTSQCPAPLCGQKDA